MGFQLEAVGAHCRDAEVYLWDLPHLACKMLQFPQNALALFY